MADASPEATLWKHKQEIPSEPSANPEVVSQIRSVGITSGVPVTRDRIVPNR
jgi:hypothetical protein